MIAVSRLVQADDGTVRMMRPPIDFEDILHAGCEGGVGLRRNDPLLLEVRLKCFFERPPDRVVAGAIDNVDSTTAISSSVSVHRCDLWVAESRPARSLGLSGAVEDALSAERGECLRVRAASRPPSSSGWRVRAMVSTLVSSASAIWPSLQASPASDASAFNSMRAFNTWRAGLLPFWIRASSFPARPRRLDHYLFTQVVRDHDASPALPEI